jgi:hypothetical protein
VGIVVALETLDGFETGVGGEMFEIGAAAIFDAGEPDDFGGKNLRNTSGGEREKKAEDFPGTHGR